MKARNRLRFARSIAVAFAGGGAIAAGTTLLIVIVFGLGAAAGNHALDTLLWYAVAALAIFAGCTVAGGVAWFHISDMQEENRE
jgi:hypothetical protein